MIFDIWRAGSTSPLYRSTSNAKGKGKGKGRLLIALLIHGRPRTERFDNLGSGSWLAI